MTVYVDPLVKWGGSKSFCWKKSCHLMADTLTELHDFASRLRMKRSWFQKHRSVAHYDLTENKRKQAVRMGAQEVVLAFRPENRGYTIGSLD